MASWLSMLHGFSRTAVALVIAVWLLAVCSGENFRLVWTPDGVREYNSSNPLVVQLGDLIMLECPDEGAFSYSNLWILNHEGQFEQCDCSAVDGEDCNEASAKNSQCIPDVDVMDPILNIRRNDAELNSVFNFNPGKRYYLVSYAPEPSLAGAFSLATSGGQCLEGLKMVMDVAAIPTTKPTTTESVWNATENTGAPSTDDGVTVTSPATASGDSSSVESSEEVMTSTDETVVEIAILPSRQIRDWHIAVITVLGSVVLAFVVAAAVGTVSFMLYRRRGDPAIHQEGDVCKEDLSKKSDKSSYPVEVFKDPIDSDM